MKPLAKRTFMHFVVALPEKGDVEGMAAMLEAHPEHRNELLFGERPGVDQGNYSAWAYATWLCHFEAHREGARAVVRWLIEQGHRADIWSALAFDDCAAIQEVLESNPHLARAQHPLFGHTALELGLTEARPVLLAHGADDGTVVTALLLGDTERARAMIFGDPNVLGTTTDEAITILDATLTNGHDELACDVIASMIADGVDLTQSSDLLSMAATWGNPRAAAALIAAGLDPNHRSGIFTPLSMCISRSVAPPQVVAEVVKALLAGGAKVRRTKIDGKSLQQWCQQKNLAEVAELLRSAARRAD